LLLLDIDVLVEDSSYGLSYRKQGSRMTLSVSSQ